MSNINSISSKKNYFLKKEIYNFFLKYKRYFFAGLFFLFLSGGIQLLIPILFGDYLNQFFSIKKIDSGTEIIIPLLLLSSIIVLQFVFTFVQDYFFIIFSEKSIGDLRKNLYFKFLKLPIPFHDKNTIGSLLSLMNNDVLSVRDLYSAQLSKLIYSAFILLFSIIILFIVNYKLAIILFLIVPISMISASLLGVKIKNNSYKTQELYSIFNSIIEESLSKIKTIKIFPAEKKEYEKISININSIISKSIKNNVLNSILSISSLFLIIISLFIIFWYASYMIYKGGVLLSDIVPFALNIIYIVNSLIFITNFIGNLEKANGATIRLIDIMQCEEEIYLTDKSIPLQQFKQQIIFKNVTVKYDESKVALKKINLLINKGDKIVIIGKNESGKTTLINSLLRFYDVNEGGIYIDGINIDNTNLKEYRNLFSVVSQDLDLFDSTLNGNIVYGSDVISENRLNIVKNLSLIEKIKDGEDIGKNGIQLSGGQKQKVVLSRALYKNSDIYILDEFMSAMDSSSKNFIKEKVIEDYLKEKTIISITHDFSIINNFNKIVVLDDGEIIDIGSHNDLLNNNKIYTELYNKYNPFYID